MPLEFDLEKPLHPIMRSNNYMTKISPIMEAVMLFRIRLDTTYFAENWKHCSKIIFRCVNSVVGLVNSAFCLLHSECMCMNSAVTVHTRWEKKTWGKNVNPNTHSIWANYIHGKGNGSRKKQYNSMPI